jgi:hypothetical protein
MAQSTVTRSGITLKIPGTYVEQSVISNQGGIGLSGVITLVGEANEGPHWSEAEDLSSYAFRPDQLNAAAQMFGSGNLIDGFRAAISANGDANLAGSVNVVYLIKTNQSTKASADINRSGLGLYATAQAKRAGKPGNSISLKNTTATSEVAPSIANLGLYLDPSDSTDLTFRINGGAELVATIAAVPGTMPSSLATALEAFVADGILAQGGVERGILPGGAATLSLAASGLNVSISLSTGSWAVQPTAGDVLLIRAGSSIEGSGQQNIGSYRVLSSTATAIVAAPINTNGAITAVSGALQGTGGTRAVEAFSPMTVTNASGMDREILDGVTGNITSSDFTSSSVKLSLDSGIKFASDAQVGELVYVNSPFVGVLAGWYQVATWSNSSTGQVTLNRLSNGALTPAPASTPVGSSLLKALKADIDGAGKSMELKGDANSAAIARKTNSGASLTELDSLILSAAERSVQTLVTKPAATNPITETFVLGGEVALTVGYKGDTCTLSITDSALTTSCSVAADNLALDLADFATLKQLVDYLNSQPAYTAAVADSRFNALAPARLDNVSVEAASSLEARPARLKKDADEWFRKVSESTMIELPTYASKGLPDHETASKFLADGAKGATSSADVVNAIDACESANTNFLVTLFDRDASADIADSLTDAASTYVVDAVNAYAKAHAIAQSEVKARKNRIAVVSKQASFADAKTAARDLSHPRVAMAWAKMKDVAADGTIKTFPAWYKAAKTAGLSAVAGYKGIVKKFVACSGVVYPAGFDPRKRGDLEDALESGLLIIEPVNTGGFRYVSDQTTYNIDNNFVYNSIQAVYLADLISLTLIQNGDLVLIGKSVAQVSASVARGFVKTQMDNFLRLNWIARSDDAPLGYRNLTVQLNGGVLSIDVEVKLAGLIFFCPISLAISEVSQSA